MKELEHADLDASQKLDLRRRFKKRRAIRVYVLESKDRYTIISTAIYLSKL